jgi:hypothetical protein
MLGTYQGYHRRSNVRFMEVWGRYAPVTAAMVHGGLGSLRSSYGRDGSRRFVRFTEVWGRYAPVTAANCPAYPISNQNLTEMTI